MNLLKLPLAYLLLFSVVAVPVAGQQKRRTHNPPAKTPAAPAPAPATPVTFDTLLAANSYKIYGEVRGVGQLIRSNAVNDVLDPLLKLGGPPEEFLNIVNWLKGHADELVTSRMMVAAWATAKEIPEVVVAIEFSSTDDATKFESQLNGMLGKLLPPTVPKSSPSPEKSTDQPQPASEAQKEPPAPVPSYYLQRADSLVLISEKPLQLKKLRPKDSKLLSEDANFRVAYNRFSSEPIFVYVDIGTIQKESEQRQKEAVEEWKKQEEARKAAEEKKKAEDEQEGETDDKFTITEEVKSVELVATMRPSPEVPGGTGPKEPTEAEMLSNAFMVLRNSLFGGAPDLPEALGIGFSPDNESFDVRALLIDAPGEASDPIPLFSGLKISGPVTPESPAVLPADSELVVMLSLDLPTIHALMMASEAPQTFLSADNQPVSGDNRLMVSPLPIEAPLATIERILKINVKDDLLPLLGSEVAVSLPMGELGFFGPPSSGPRPIETKDEKDEKGESKPAPRAPFVVISLRDREGMRKMMPRLLEGFAGKAAAALAQTERREDTEIVSFANAFAYAFVGNFLVLSPDAATTRSVVDAYLKGETLASNTEFRNYTRWQPRQLQAQVYLSSAFAESYRTWASSPSTHITDEARAFVTRVSATPQPITYSLSNDGLGALHELHVPKSLLITALAGAASSANPPETVKHERAAMSTLWSIFSAQLRYKEEKGPGYASIEDLIAADMVSKEMMESSGYKFEIRLTPEGFELSAVPIEYGKTGKMSFFLDHQSATIRGGDHGGGPASGSDPPIGW